MLLPLELLYRGVTRIRRALYRSEVLQRRHLPRPVVSVGNLAMGGSGKTPTVIALGKALMAAGIRPAILTRGYGGSASSQSGTVVEGNDTARYGDEPVLLATSLPGVDVIVGADRYESGLSYLRTADCEVFLLDDGFQHFRLARNLDLVIHTERSGPLREGPAALRHADFVIVRGRPRTPAEIVGRLLPAALVPTAVRVDGEALPLSWLRGRRLFAFAGLADNRQFFRTLEELGALVVGSHSFRDHHQYEDADLAAIEQEARLAGAEMLICTEKDKVKLPSLACATLAVGMEIDGLSRVVARIQSLLQLRGAADEGATHSSEG